MTTEDKFLLSARFGHYGNARGARDFKMSEVEQDGESNFAGANNVNIPVSLCHCATVCTVVATVSTGVSKRV